MYGQEILALGMNGIRSRNKIKRAIYKMKEKYSIPSKMLMGFL